MARLEAAFQIGPNLNIVRESLQIPFAVYATESEVRMKRPVFRGKSETAAGALHALLEAHKAIGFAAEAAPDHSWIFGIWETPQIPEPEFKRPLGPGAVLNRLAQLSDDGRIDLTQKFKSQMNRWDCSPADIRSAVAQTLLHAGQHGEAFVRQRNGYKGAHIYSRILATGSNSIPVDSSYERIR